jgi:predicted RNase H-like HicB family nuclease
MANNSYTAIVEKEGDLYVALYPDFGVASQGTTIEGANIQSQRSSRVIP